MTGDPRSGPISTVAIDGPAGAGKSTVARALAERLGLERLDTGAMYRAVAWVALERGIDINDATSLAELARTMTLNVNETVTVDGVDVTDAIRSAAVDAAVSVVAANAEVRTELVRRQRAWVDQRGGGVVEGRDIGTVVLPEADLKIYLTASPAERARRRAKERSDGRSVEEVAAQMTAVTILTRPGERPRYHPDDMAHDAMVVDSTDKTVESIVEEVLRCR